ncbi:VPLPA-CTERM-specific exosortase XrtD [Parvularcula sp. LCG005]|uniref:VPLPA-CTERM-specific exosortase XrtD n=1 Tax=Parvularcula sp. LCG005 TaxID=3078805 RepID=UPI00294253EE|nr:VPLPA-CTERM-specific exosortase XrtD [Parvularcula sp. LCG005]WOI53290.1 VPLPA-CTERM-specific exosortase XrtD [Parvularcula sp. LCG005]
MSANLPLDRSGFSAGAFFKNNRYRTIAIVLVSIIAVVAFAFWAALGNLWFRWGQAQELNHSYFLPLVAGWMLWERRRILPMSAGKPSLFGLIPMIGGCLLLYVGALTHIFLLQHLGFMAILVALPLMLGGFSLFAVMIVPIAYMIFMIPPPYWVITVLSGKFQLMSSSLGVDMMRLFDIPVYLSGNVIELPSTKLAVVEACSGLRYLFPFLSLGALAAYFYTGPLWQRIIIFLTTIPITILMNSVRIALTGILIEKVGGNHTEGFLHMFEGWMVFLLCIAMLVGVIWIFTLMRGQKNPLVFVSVDDVKPANPTGVWTEKLFIRNGIITVVLVLLSGVFAHGVLQRQLIIPEREPLQVLPLEFPDYSVRETALTMDVENVLGADDYIVMDMRNDEGDLLNIYIAYLEAQRDGRSWHSPMQCLPGGGWQIQSRDIVPVTRADGRTYHHNRMIIQQGENRLLVYYWYDQRGRKVANEFMMKFTVMYDAVTKHRSDGAMVRIMTPVLASETLEQAEARLEALRVRLEPLLPKYVPE